MTATSRASGTTVPFQAEMQPNTGGPATGSSATALWALFFGVGLLMLGNGLQGTLLGVRAESEGFDLTVIGAVMTAYFVGFLVGARLVIAILATVGHIRVFAALASTASASVLVHALLVHPVSWLIMRFITGACMAGLYVVIESWLNAQATNATRGRLLSIYMVVTMAGFGGGQFLLTLADPDDFHLFMVSSLLVSVALVPMALSAASAPPLDVPEPVRIVEIMRLVPTGAAASMLSGFAHGTLLSLGAVYAAGQDLSNGRIALFVAAPIVGSVLFQWPIGSLSDRLPRRAVMVATAFTATLLAGLLAVADPQGILVYALLVLLGGASFPLYSLAIAYTHDWLPATKITGASGALVRINGTGAVAGPLLTAVLMSSVDAAMFFWTLMGAHALVGLYVLWRIMVRDAVPVDEQVPYVAFPNRSSRIAARLLLPRREKSAKRRTPPASKTPPHRSSR